LDSELKKFVLSFGQALFVSTENSCADILVGTALRISSARHFQ
jgi:hypothetical protein